jgi:hypothetical protein
VLEPDSRIAWNRILPIGQAVELLPEPHRIAQLAERDVPQPAVLLGEHEGLTTRRERLLVPSQDRAARRLATDGKVVALRREVGAGRKSDEIVGPGQRKCFVEVVHAPDKAAFLIPPRPEVLHVQISDRQHHGGTGQVGTRIRPDLHPAVEGGAKEREWAGRHKLVLLPDIGANQFQLLAKPTLVATGRFLDVHWRQG